MPVPSGSLVSRATETNKVYSETLRFCHLNHCQTLLTNIYLLLVSDAAQSIFDQCKSYPIEKQSTEEIGWMLIFPKHRSCLFCCCL